MDILSLVLIFSVHSLRYCSSVLTHDDFRTLQENKLTSELLRSIEKYIPAGNKYMREDFYLGKWLKEFQFDVKQAGEHLQEEMKWRNESRMDAILNEDFSEIQAEFHLNSIDELGRPILLIPFESWNFRQAIISGKRNQMERYVLRMFEEANVKLRETHERNPNVTGFVGYTNLKGFNEVQHGSKDCIPFYTLIVPGFEKHYPHSVAKSVIFNIPGSFEGYLKGMKSAMSNDLIRRLKVYGTNKNTWPHDLRQFVAYYESEQEDF